jgi:hypothetical protein
VVGICHWENWRENWLGCKISSTSANLSVCENAYAFLTRVFPRAKRAKGFIEVPGKKKHPPGKSPLLLGMCPVQSRPKVQTGKKVCVTKPDIDHLGVARFA